MDGISRRVFPGTAGMAAGIGAGMSAVLPVRMLRDAKVTTELHTYAGAPHIFDQVPECAAAPAVMFDLFVDRYILNRRPFLPPRRG